MKEPEDVKVISDEKVPTSTAEIALACSMSAVVSVAMIILNKAIIQYIPFSAGLVLIQNSTTVLLVLILKRFKTPQDLSWKCILDNLPCAVLFGANMFTSMQALSYLSVTAFTVLRNTQSILSYPLDYYMRGERLKPLSIYFLLTILIGTCAYCGHDMRGNVEGIAWASAHLVSTTFYAVLTKMRMQDETENKLTRTLDMALFNNVLSAPVIGAVAAIQAVYMEPPLIRQECGVDCCVMVGVSCFGGCAMSLTGLNTQVLLSPVTYLTFNNLNKIPAMLISTVIWPKLEITDSIPEIMGIMLSVYGGLLYALSKQGDVHLIAILVSVGMCIALVPLVVLSELAVQQPASNTTVVQILGVM
jgi:hypothetical protein